ncbi:MAG TPA: SpoIID/LytB domain-containing protein [candidate division Zixibacteria bacterium]|nr:SpoIID/LytB domain-containing protein [candidate division Zixibacteria bacterium]
MRVRLPDIDSVVQVSSDGRYILRVFHDASGDAVIFSSEEDFEVAYEPDGIAVRTASAVVLAERATGVSIHTVSRYHLIRIGEVPYYGTLVFGSERSGGRLLVNRLNLDDYLAGVLTPELGERTPEEFEAVKAQAVAARTYALSHLGQYNGSHYDLRADVGDQVYVGASKQRDWVDRAVRETAGEVLSYGHHLIDAFYHSTCGGYTDAIEDIWGGPARPYLTSAPDDTFCVWSRYTEWTEVFDRETLLTNLNAYRSQTPAAPVGTITTITDIRLKNTTPGGRTVTMVIATPDGEWSITSDQIRWALGRPSRPGSILPSSRIALALTRDPAGNVSGMTVTGSGYGHGIGMCQCGMIGRARAGAGYRDILTHYYQGVRVTAVY